jgi:acetylornithine deacetylase/succinyl-diaminopimelate desuccinylase-like protein
MTSQHTSTPADSTLKECAHKSASDVLGTLETLVRIPSLSLPGSDPDVLSHSAQTVKSLLETVLPWDSIEIVQASEGAPAIIAHKVAEPGFPTVLLYAHHDVQPAGDAQLWESPPFEPDVREGRLYGRGSADDGAGIAVHLHSLAAVHEACEGSVPLGVTVFIEGEEESGSPTFTSLLERYRDLLQADLIIVADSDNPDPAIPGLTTSLRGVVGVTVGVRTLQSSVHSGLFGGPVPDALTTLIRLLSTLHDEDGRAAIEALYPRLDIDGGDEDTLRRESGLLPGIPLWGKGSINQRLWAHPAITITGIDAPAPELASNTLLATARAKVSVRIPPGFPAEEAAVALENHLRHSCPAGVELGFEHWEKGEGFLHQAGHPMVRAVEQALEDGFGAEVVHQGLGGSIPFIAHLQHTFPEAAIAVTGVEDRASAAHGPNESVNLAMLERAVVSQALLLGRLCRDV